MPDPLTPAERRAWRAALVVADVLRLRVTADLKSVTDLSHAEQSVLMHIEEVDSGRINQQRLADAMYWSKSRLSRQLTRMQARGLVERSKDSDSLSVTVSLTSRGAQAIRAIEGAHAAAVRDHLLSVATDTELAAVLSLAARLVRPESSLKREKRANK
ncbi:MarR family winged helix-turn-helix transcriptional regulator [Kutzneria sp. NPDC052558]|uniref:MarR family winged helix-turn-helix transcriptional regulator n=1 Tax=Kutzneria sp. NPDC052558 TaxID=3364121 RepID=UPI0037C984CB